MVRGAIASALGQTCHEIEVIAVDDGSTDCSWDVITRCAVQDARVVPLRMARNNGPAAARNIAIARATGRWLALLDADDALMPERLSAMVERAEAWDADLLADNLLQRDFETKEFLGLAFPEDPDEAWCIFSTRGQVNRRIRSMVEPGNHALQRALLHRQMAVDFMILREALLQGDHAASMRRIQRVPVSYPLRRARAFMARRPGVPRRTEMAH
ncbi:MAG: glycosyltransferase [Acetobacteraceae bacterium]|nr:glycosyltransferase [Acetobacteraceae bacterium]